MLDVDTLVANLNPKYRRTVYSAICSKCSSVFWSICSQKYCTNKCKNFKHGLNNGYVAIGRNKNGGRIYEHRFVTNAPKGYIVHHINGIKTDNRLENLQIMKQADHNRLHKPHEARWGK